jgi:hypothetical protein
MLRTFARLSGRERMEFGLMMTIMILGPLAVVAVLFSS